MITTPSFNPLPARRPGATEPSYAGHHLEAVSILSQPEGRELHVTAYLTNLVVGVSILSQPEGRELPVKVEYAGLGESFQSSPSPKAGSYAPLTAA